MPRGFGGTKPRPRDLRADRPSLETMAGRLAGPRNTTQVLPCSPPIVSLAFPCPEALERGLLSRDRRYRGLASENRGGSTLEDAVAVLARERKRARRPIPRAGIVATREERLCPPEIRPSRP